MAAGHMDPALAAKLARRAHLNHESMIAFGAAIAGMVGLFVIFNIMHVASPRHPIVALPVSFLRYGVSPFRLVYQDLIDS